MRRVASEDRRSQAVVPRWCRFAWWLVLAGLAGLPLSALADPRPLPPEVEDNWDEILRALPGGGRDEPAPVDEAPAKAGDTPAKAGNNAPAKAGNNTPAKANNTPTKANNTPAKAGPTAPAWASDTSDDVAAQEAITKEWEAMEPAPADESTRGSRRSRHAKQDTKKKHSHDERTKPIKRGVSASYQGLIAQWHAPAPSDQTYLSDSTPALVFQVVGEPTPFVVLVPEDKGGPFDAEQLEVARAAFRGGDASSVNERLLGLIHRATRHFEAPFVNLVSGIRRDRGASRHTHGLAADIVLPGVEDEDLADFFRQQGFIGVGVYTRAGFVHVDVRDRSFFWVDPSPPGKSMKIRPVRADEAKAADEAAIARGEEPFVNPPRLSRALAKRAAKKRSKRAENGKKLTRPPS
ncbi:MAG: D-Ala-D-Ala carboxypeptidase family metallohydrolase [Myxococcales bacterium]